MSAVVYFSSASRNTERFVEHCDFPSCGVNVFRKCHVPLMYRFELMGTREDVHAVREGVRRFFSDTPTD